MKPIYHVPVIPQNLRKEETIVQIAEALKYLDDISNDIIQRVNSRIQNNVIQLSNISSRVEVVRKKIDKLSGSKTATQVFSSSKYPGTDIKKRYVSIFKGGEPITMEKFNIDIKSTNVKNDQMENLLFYHVKVKDEKKRVNLSGLGKIPTDLTSVSDLLLFNSNKNPYNKYEMSDPLQGSKMLRKEEVSEATEIGAAPASILDKTSLMRSTGQNFSYTPFLGEVPALDVPIHLPDLPGIADDLRFVTDIGPGIAPSVTTTPNVQDKPIVAAEIKEQKPEPVTASVVAEDPVVSTSSIVKEEIKVEATPVVETVKKQEEVIDIPEPVNVTTKKEEVVKSAEVTDSGGARASLMEAIRQAGGKAKAKLKSTEPKDQKAPSGGGDLMSDLYAKLAMRRKGISGSKNQSHGQIESGTVMFKVASMIPPPPPVTADSDEQTDNADQEWED